MSDKNLYEGTSRKPLYSQKQKQLLPSVDLRWCRHSLRIRVGWKWRGINIFVTFVTAVTFRSTCCSIAVPTDARDLEDNEIGRAHLLTLRKRNIDDLWQCKSCIGGVDWMCQWWISGIE
jgi:hypothetical protein